MLIEISIVNLPRAKRLFDVIVASLLSIIFLPFVLFIIIWIVLEQILIKESRGPLLYSELRVSQGKIFKFYKWRTFKTSAIAAALQRGSVIHTAELQQNLANLTGYGRFLKKIYLDELPQLWNVLKGDMTMVGPRPTNLANSTNYKKDGDYTREVIKCGLTGPFQSRKGRTNRPQIEWDREYINFVATNPGWKVVLKDLRILFGTARTILAAKGI